MKGVEDADNLREGVDRWQGTSKGKELSAAPHIFLAGLNSGSYKAHRSDRTLTWSKLENEILYSV